MLTFLEPLPGEGLRRENLHVTLLLSTMGAIAGDSATGVVLTSTSFIGIFKIAEKENASSKPDRWVCFGYLILTSFIER